MRRLIIVLIISLLFVNCKKDEIMFFEGKDALSIYVNQYEPDSTAYSFASGLDSRTRDTLLLKVRIQGRTSSANRLFRLYADSGSTAVEGQDYILPEVNLPADSVRTLYPVILLRSPKLKDRTLNLNVTVKASDTFEKGAVGIEIGKKSSSIARYKIKFNDYLSKPSYWDDIERYVGEFSVAKLRFMFMVYGQDTPFGDYSTGELLNMRLRLRAAQKAYEEVNGPLIDENGNQVLF
ncbi:MULTISPECIES: DUF4843 domain-containing protein [Sphingobacterium]|uniref:DUF4843 domain-containing protein n=1 Tax=Sphingobacterium TaxID=28453 RepID=UPI00257F30FC|nr:MULTISPECIES: DUF4843 domain-containing protein [Sphingobacterium]